MTVAAWAPAYRAGPPSEALLRRERESFNQMIRIVQGRPHDPAGGAESELDGSVVLAAFESSDRVRRRAASFVAGRSAIPDADRSVVDAALRSMLDARASSDRVEAAMALALLGDVATAKPVLVEESRGAGAGAWSAASYLAQLGDPAAWPSIVASLEGDDGHGRLMAARELVAFLPFDGTDVDGVVVDASDRLRSILDDVQESVRAEAPSLVAEAGLPDAPELLRRAAANSSDPRVREASAALIVRLGL